MQPSLYVSESLKTEARDFTPVIERFKDPALAALTFQLFSDLTTLSAAIDGVKKNIFYGKEIDGITESKSQALHNAAVSGVIPELEATQRTVTSDVKNIRMLHAIVGLASEIGEMVDCFMEAMAEGKEMDTTNMKEEFGDAQWYSSIALDTMGSSYEEIWQMNRNKLAKRYAGQKFTEEAAINRDLATERQTLESSQQ